MQLALYGCMCVDGVPDVRQSQPTIDEKRLLLQRLNDALHSLARRMRQQQENAQAITALAARAEQIAEMAWKLNSLRDRDGHHAASALAADVKALAAEAASAAERAGQAALLGQQVATAIAAHSAQITLLLKEIDSVADVAAVRAILRPLVVTLAELPQQLKADRAMLKDVESVTALAQGLAERADELTANGLLQNRAAVAISRDLRGFAAEASSFSRQMRSEARLAVEAIDTLSNQTRAFSEGTWQPETQPTAHSRLMALARTGATHVVGTLPAGRSRV
jgi:hypothetical protein